MFVVVVFTLSLECIANVQYWILLDWTGYVTSRLDRMVVFECHSFALEAWTEIPHNLVIRVV